MDENTMTLEDLKKLQQQLHEDLQVYNEIKSQNLTWDDFFKRIPVCQRCHQYISQHAHHLRYPAQSLSDYWAVCKKCHREIHKR